MSMRLPELIFWTSTAVAVGSYAIYPPLIWCLSKLFGRAPQPPEVSTDQLPSATLLIAAHDEQAVIADRLDNALAMDYPPGRLRIVVASDGSTDGTADVVRGFAVRG